MSKLKRALVLGATLAAMNLAAITTVAQTQAAVVGGRSASAREQPAENAAIEWNAIASTAIMTTAGQPPHAAVLSLAMVQGAVYDTVNAIDGNYPPYLVAPPANPGDSKEAAAATAAFRVLVGFLEATRAPAGRPSPSPAFDPAAAL